MDKESIGKYIESVKQYEFNDEEKNIEYKEMASNILEKDNLVNNLSVEQLEYMSYYLIKRKLVENGIKIDINIEDLGDRTVGFCSRKKISINTQYIKIAANNKANTEEFNVLDIMKAINHEVEHAIQTEKMKTQTYDYNAIRYVKEDICHELYGDSFYKYNYSNINFEHDANIAGFLNTLEDLKDLAPQHVEGYEEYCKVNCEILKNKLKQGKFEFEAFGEKINDQKNLATTAGINLAIRNKGNEILLNNPLLLKEYNSDGSKKNFEQLMSDKKNHLKNLSINKQRGSMVIVQGENLNKTQALNKEYDDIVSSDPLLQIQQLEEVFIDNIVHNNSDKKDSFNQISKITKNATINYKDIVKYQSDRINELKKQKIQVRKLMEKGEIKENQYHKQSLEILKEIDAIRDIYSQVIVDNENLDEQRKKSIEHIKEMDSAKKILKEKYDIDFNSRQDSEKKGFIASEDGLKINRYTDKELYIKILLIEIKNKDVIYNLGNTKEGKQLEKENILIKKLCDELSSSIETKNMESRIEDRFKDTEILNNISKNDFRSDLKDQVVDTTLKDMEKISDNKNSKEFDLNNENLKNNNTRNPNNNYER